jgi:hypothetical protein
MSHHHKIIGGMPTVQMSPERALQHCKIRENLQVMDNCESPDPGLCNWEKQTIHISVLPGLYSADMMLIVQKKKLKPSVEPPLAWSETLPLTHPPQPGQDKTQIGGLYIVTMLTEVMNHW